MKLLSTSILLFAGSAIVTSLSIPAPEVALIIREDSSPLPEETNHSDLVSGSVKESLKVFWKRKGGGGGGVGGGGRVGTSSGGSSSSSSSGSSGSSGSAGSRGVGGGSSSSNAGGRSATGSGSAAAYGGGRYYGGGARTPYGAGGRSPLGLTPFLLPIAALSIFPGLWLYGAYAYNFNNPYYYRNDTSNETVPLPVSCLCEQYSSCGCDDNNDNEYLTSVLPNGTAESALNKTLVQIQNVNGTRTVVLNGTLPNGTTAPDGSSSMSGSASSLPNFKQVVLETAGLWMMGLTVFATVMSI